MKRRQWKSGSGFFVGLVALMFLFASFPAELFAGRSGGGGGYSSSSRSSSSSGGSRSSGVWGGSSRSSSPSPSKSYTPSPSSNKTQTTTKSWAGERKAVAPNAPTKVTTTAPMTRDAASAAKTKSISREQSAKAMNEYRARQAKFSQPERPIPSDVRPPSVKRTSSSTGYNYTPSTRVVRVNHYYSNIGYAPPRYVYMGYPSYGIWDAVFLYSMINMMNGDFFYHHRSDPQMSEFMANARENARTDAELQRKLDRLDSEVAEMKTRNTPVNQDYLPKDVDPDVAYSQAYVDKNTDKLYNDGGHESGVAQAATQSPADESSGWPWGKIIIGLLVIGAGVYFVFVRKS